MQGQYEGQGTIEVRRVETWAKSIGRLLRRPRRLKALAAAAVLASSVGIAGMAQAAVVSDFTVIVGNAPVQIGDNLSPWGIASEGVGFPFTTENRREASTAVLMLSVSGLTDGPSEVWVNGRVVGHISPVAPASALEWHNQTITFDAGILRPGERNFLHIRIVRRTSAADGGVFDDFSYKNVICFFQQRA
jgi:hypothetical protein